MKLPDLTPHEAAKFEQYLKYFRNKKNGSEIKKGLIPVRKFLTIRETANHFGVSTRTLYRHRENKLIKFYKLSGRTVIKLKEMESVIKEAKRSVFKGKSISSNSEVMTK